MKRTVWKGLICGFDLHYNVFKFTKSRDQARIEAGNLINGKKNAFYMRDNGICLGMQYAGTIFMTFQTLYSQTEYG